MAICMLEAHSSNIRRGRKRNRNEVTQLKICKRTKLMIQHLKKRNYNLSQNTSCLALGEHLMFIVYLRMLVERLILYPATPLDFKANVSGCQPPRNFYPDGYKI